MATDDQHVIITGGIITNATPEDGAQNPHECHFFSWPVVYVDAPEPGGSIIHQSWELEPDKYPLDLSINSSTGLISGTIRNFTEQPAIKDFNPTEKISLNGDNWQSTGRPIGFTYTYTFGVKRKYIYMKPTPDGSAVIPIDSETSYVPHILTVIKSNTMDGEAFIRGWLSVKETVIPTDAGDVRVEHKIVVGTKEYRYEDIDALQLAHPGPWRKC